MRRWWAAIAIGGLAAWALAPLLHLTYLADDFALFLMIRQRVEQGDLSLGTFFAEQWSEAYAIYRPLTTLSLAIDDSVFAHDPVGPHLTNILLHITTAFAVGLLAASLLPSHRRRGGLTATALYLLYPFHTETLSWLAARGDLLATAFTVIALLIYQRARSGTVTIATRRSLLVTTGLLLAAALCSKESAIAVTCLPALLDLVTGRAPRWRSVGAWITRYGPFLLLSVLFVLARAAVIGELVGSYGGVSPYHPDRLREFAVSLPTTVRDLLIHDSPHSTSVFWVRVGRYTTWTALVLLLVAGLSVRRRTLRPASLFALGWIGLVVGPFLPLYTVNLGLAGGRMFTGPAAALAVFAGRLVAGAAQTPRRRQISAVAVTALVLTYGLTFHQVMGNYTRATETILAVHEQVTRQRDEQPAPTAFGILDPPTIEDRAPVFGAFLQQSFNRYFRPEDPITVRTDLSAQPLSFLITKGQAIQLPLCILRWNGESRELERISARIPPPEPATPWIMTDFSEWNRQPGHWTSPSAAIPTRTIFAIRIEATCDRDLLLEIRVRTTEDDFANPQPVIPMALTAGRQSRDRTLGPPDLWPLAGHVVGLELRWPPEAEVRLDSVALLPLVPRLTIVDRGTTAGGRERCRVLATPEHDRYRLTAILRRKRFERTWNRAELPSTTDDEGRSLVTLDLPSRAELRKTDPSASDMPISWYLEALPAESDAAVARTPVLPR